MRGFLTMGLILAVAIGGLAPWIPPFSSRVAAQQVEKPLVLIPSPVFGKDQSADHYLASKFMGLRVVGPTCEKIGTVRDLIFDKKGKIEFYLVSIGGFLGMGTKDVAFAPESFRESNCRRKDTFVLQTGATKQELRSAKRFEPYTRPK